MPQVVKSLMVNGIEVCNLIVITSRFDGFDVHHREKFKAGAQIAYKKGTDLTIVQCDAIFGLGKRYNLMIQWPLKAEQVTPNKQDFVMSEWQQAINDDLMSDQCHVLIDAKAGSGKTATLVRLVQEMNKLGMTKTMRVIYLAFGKQDSITLNERLRGTGVRAMTSHAFGFSLLKRIYGDKLNINDNKDDDVFKRLLCDDLGWDYAPESFRRVRKCEDYELRGAVMDLIEKAKNWAIFPNMESHGWVFSEQQRQEILDLIQKYEIEIPEKFNRQQVVQWACRIIAQTIPVPGEGLSECTFTDMLYLPLVLKLALPYFDIVFTDESQDFNRCQLVLLECLTKVEKP